MQPVMERHFADIAPSYEDIRLTNLEPVQSILPFLPGGPLKGIDIGCGNGRYTRLLAEQIGSRLELSGADASQGMLDVLAIACPEVEAYCCNAESIPLASGEYDFITTYNAVHHFDIPGFFTEAHRLLKPGGLLFVYTRTPSQNAQSVWGRYFPMFIQAETRLRSPSDFWSMALKAGLSVADIKTFHYDRVASLQELVHRARSYHYSTFRLIPEGIFETCIDIFESVIRDAYVDLDKVKWIDMNLLLVLRKE